MNKVIKATKQYSASEMSENVDTMLDDVWNAPANKVLAEIYKAALTSVISALKTYANTLHNDRAHPFPFTACPEEECKCGRAVIDNAIAVITSKPQAAQ